VLQENYASFITACAPPEPRPVRPGLTAVDGEILEVGSAPSVAPAIRPWDPARYRDPEAFDISRTDGGNLALGHGIHHCLGAPLAALHARFTAMRLAVDPAEPGWGHGAGLVLRGLSELPVVPGG
jgi:cytochrome P450